MNENRGIAFILMTALVSGISIFLNKYAVGGMNAFVFTTMKNTIVALLLVSLILILGELKNLKKLDFRQWGQLALIGLVGGSVPFLLYFYGLKLTSAINAGFIHKTLFVWVLIFGFLFLKEKINKELIIGAVLLLIGNFILFSKFSGFGLADAIILIAVILWGLENVLSKKFLEQSYGRIVAFGRMFFGSIIMLAFLAFTGQLNDIAALNTDQIIWIFVTGILLFFYVFFYYTGLKYVRASVAAALLALGQPITAVLSLVFSGTLISANDALGFVLIILGCGIILGTGYFASLVDLANSKFLKLKKA
jgi:drug/metabolite transporter (DMT)-like permease